MDLQLSDDQKLFHETTQRFIESELPLTEVRRLHDDPTGYDRSWLKQAAELGWFAGLVPEANGGGSISGEGVLDLAIVAEEIGRFVQPGPFIPMNVVAEAIADHGSDEQRDRWLADIAAAECVATWAFADQAGNWDSGSGLTAVAKGDEFRLDGIRGFVQDAQSADLFLVAATVDGVTAQFLVPADTAGLRVEPLECFDLSRRMGEVVFDGVTLPGSARLGTGSADEALERQLQVALALQAAETIGVLDTLFTMTVEYAKDRIAFGRPIGSFQALKHIMADMGLFLETAKAGAVAAARAVQNRTDDAAEVVSMVAAYLSEAGTMIAQESLQIHGGIGYTWEHDLHLYYRRAQTNAALYGEATWHRERVCAIHEL